MIRIKQGWRKWPMVLFIIGLIVLMFFAFGCSSTPAETTTTPLQQLNTDVDGLKTRATNLENLTFTLQNSVASHATSIANLQSNIAGYAERISNLESGATAGTEVDLTEVNASIANIIMRLDALETVAPIPTPSGATPTPTPTSIINRPPTITSLTASSIDSINKNWIVSCVASDLDGDILNYNWATTDGLIYVMMSNEIVIWSLTTNGSVQSITCQVNDGHGGYAIDIESVSYP